MKLVAELEESVVICDMIEAGIVAEAEGVAVVAELEDTELKVEKLKCQQAYP